MNQKQETLKFFIKKGFLLDNELLDFFTEIDDRELAKDILDKISMISKVRVISKEMITANFTEIKPLFLNISKEKTEIFSKFFGDIKEKPAVKEQETQEKKETVLDFKILSSNIIPYKKIEVKDFTTHFKNRYNLLKDILKERKELSNLISIDKIGNNRDFSVIGLVNNKRVTKNKNILLEVEDPTGKVMVLVNQNKEEVFEKTKEVVLDDVIGIRCNGGSDIIFANDLFFPDIFLEEKKKIEEEVYAVFISDMHIGSTNFLEENFARFIDWLNGVGCTEDQKSKVDKIKYIFIVGDTVDGVGIFPTQESMLDIKNMKDQYKKLAFYLDKIPKNINIIMCPGQHDAVRVPEPQPPVDSDFAEPLINIKNLYLVSNPSLIEIGASKNKEGFKVLMYHGASIHSWINDIEELRLMNAHHCPAKVIKYMLRHRHLAPTHSSTTYVPDEKEDFMAIKHVPDIITTGEVHKPDIDVYNNILIVCNSCWQSITPFEEKVGNKPEPCKVPLLNLKTREIKILDFGGGK